MSKPDWEKIREEFETSDITMKDLADKHGVKASTLRSRKSREDWKQGATQQPKKKVATQRNEKKSVATQQAIEELNNNSNLTEKQKQFCLLYLKYFNATKAYQEAYGVDYNTAHSIGYRLLANDGVKEELERLKKIQRSEMYIDSLDIKREWAKQAFVDPTDFVEFGTREEEVMGMFGPVKDEEGNVITQVKNFIEFKDSVEVDGTLIKEVRMGKDGPVVQFHDKQKAMDRLMEFLIDDDVVENDDDGFLAALEAGGEELWPEE